jgi:AraC-like DNA-binding protein
MSERTVPLELVERSLAFVRRADVDLEGVLLAADVSPMLLGAADSRITEGQLTRVVQELWRSTDDELFGLGEHPLPRGTFRLLCYGMLSARDLGEALDRLGSFLTAVPALPNFTLAVGATSACVTMDSPKHFDPDGFIAATGLALVHRLAGWAIDRGFPLREVTLGWESGDLDRTIFGIRARRGDAASFVFDPALLATPLVRSDREVEEFLAASPLGLLRRPTTVVTIVEQVRRIVEQELPSGRPSATDVARRLALSPETVRKRLRNEGTSLTDVREQVMRDEAVVSLVRGDESVAELAIRLGFSDASAFTRAFRRWTGVSPGAYRRSTEVIGDLS